MAGRWVKIMKGNPKRGGPMKRILVVDEDEGIRFLYHEELSSEGYEIVSIDSCKDILKTIDEQRPDLILLDLKIGDTIDMHILREVRNRYPAIRIILCTCCPGFNNDFISDVIDYYLIKSFDLRWLKFTVNMAMKGTVRFPGTNGHEREGQGNPVSLIKAQMAAAEGFFEG